MAGSPGMQKGNAVWVKKLSETVQAAEFYSPRDAGNPAPGMYTVVGPLGEQRFSSTSLEHAAQLYLAQVCRDRPAQDAFRGVT